MVDSLNYVLIYGAISIGTGVLALVAICWAFSLQKRVKRFEAAHITLQTFMNGKSLDQLLEQYVQTVEKLGEHQEKQNERVAKVEEKLRHTVERAEIVRFNAFDDMGSDLSFSLALLDQEGNGIVLSSIYSREESRVYAKPITAGQSPYHLSNEEKEVLEKAKTTIRV